jgi:hypothetical protein
VNDKHHLFWPTETISICGSETRHEIAASSRSSPTHVPIIVHHATVCPHCLHIAEVGPTDKFGNRMVPAICGFGVSEHEAYTKRE